MAEQGTVKWFKNDLGLTRCPEFARIPGIFALGEIFTSSSSDYLAEQAAKPAKLSSMINTPTEHSSLAGPSTPQPSNAA
jgi:hypothetical protein